MNDPLPEISWGLKITHWLEYVTWCTFGDTMSIFRVRVAVIVQCYQIDCIKLCCIQTHCIDWACLQWRDEFPTPFSGWQGHTLIRFCFLVSLTYHKSIGFLCLQSISNQCLRCQHQICLFYTYISSTEKNMSAIVKSLERSWLLFFLSNLALSFGHMSLVMNLQDDLLYTSSEIFS